MLITLTLARCDVIRIVAVLTRQVSATRDASTPPATGEFIADAPSRLNRTIRPSGSEDAVYQITATPTVSSARQYHASCAQPHAVPRVAPQHEL